MAQLVKNPPEMQETWVQSLDWEVKSYLLHYSSLENSMNCSVLGSQRVGCDLKKKKKEEAENVNRPIVNKDIQLII